MTTLKKYNLAGKEIGEIEVSDRLVNAEANGQMIKDYIVALRKNARQWTAHTKTRAEVNHSNKKPHAQKGGGRARQGQLSTPQYKGGGRVFGPRAKFDQHVRINKKERRAAIRSLIAEKIRDNRVHCLDISDLEAPKTKMIADFILGREMRGGVLFLADSLCLDLQDKESMISFTLPSIKHRNFEKSIRNLPRAQFALANQINGYSVLAARHLVLTEEALQELQDWLCCSPKRKETNDAR